MKKYLFILTIIIIVTTLIPSSHVFAIPFSPNLNNSLDISAINSPTGLTKISPDNNPIPAFKWNAVAGAASYEVQIDSNGWVNIGTRLTYVHPSILNQGTHTFSVQAKDNNGNASLATTLNFNVDVVSDLTNTKIAFYSHRDTQDSHHANVYVIASDFTGETTRLTFNSLDLGFPTWSPDGSKIAFVSAREGNNEIYVMKADGSGQVNVTNNTASDHLPSWSPDGSKIAFQSDRDGNGEIYIMNADGSGQIRMTDNTADDFAPSWSPDGTMIAYESNRDGHWEIYAIDLEIRNETRLTNSPVGSSGYARPAWSPDGSKIAALTGGPEGDIYVIDVASRNTTNITAGTPELHNFSRWSPDGTKIVCEYAESVSNEWTIATMNADGSGLNVLNGGRPSGGPSWSPFLGTEPPQTPFSDFTATPTQGQVPLTVQFTDQSTGNISSWSWNLGDGGTSTLQNPSHTYNTAGTYSVSLTVSGTGGSNTTTKSNYIVAYTSTIIPFLHFPLQNFTPWNATINSIFDHSMSKSYSSDNVVIAYTGEKGEKFYGSSFVTTFNGVDLYGFKNSNGTFTVNGYYSGGGDPNYLFYDGHPGYDYRTIELGTSVPVLAAANGTAYRGDDEYGIVYIDHNNGYRTYYIHLVNSARIASGSNVYAGQQIGIAGSTGANAVHLHFEVRKIIDGQWVPVDPYGWQGGGTDSYAALSGIVNVNLWLDSVVPICKVNFCEQGTKNSINKVGIGGFFDIYVGDSTDNAGIAQVRFSSDDLLDGIRQGPWTDWYDWNVSSIGWNAELKLKSWSFDKEGRKEIWAEVKDPSGNSGIGHQNIYTYVPILLVHGFQVNDFDLDDTWSSMVFHLTGKDIRNNDDYTRVYENNNNDDNYSMKRIDGGWYVIYIANYTHTQKEGTHNSIETYALALSSEIWTIRENEKVSKVDIVAHSMGGLVSRTYIENEGFIPVQYRGDVRKLIMLGTPNNGVAPYVFTTLLVSASELATYLCGVEMIWPSDFLDKLNTDNNVSGNDTYGVEYSAIAGSIDQLGTDWFVPISSVSLPEIPNERFKILHISHWNLQKAVNSIQIVRDMLGGITGMPVDEISATLASPGELRVIDSQGRTTGLVNGAKKEEIPNSSCDDLLKSITLDPAISAYTYSVVGTGIGLYGLYLDYTKNGSYIGFFSKEIPMTVGEVHKYVVDWNLLSQGESGVTVQIDSNGDGNFERSIISDAELTANEFILQTATLVDFKPDTLSLKSKGIPVTAYIELPTGYDVSNIDISSVKLNGIVVALSKPIEIGDYDLDGIPDLMVKFNREDVQSVLQVGDRVQVTIVGIVNGIQFEGVDYIRVKE